MSHQLKVMSVEDGERLELPANCAQYTVLSETDDEGNAQVAVLLETGPRGVA